MQAHAHAMREGAGRQTGTKARSERSSEQGLFQFADNRPEVVQMKSLQALFDNRHKHATQRVGNVPERPEKVVQRVEREAQVTWAITHLVQERDYGKGQSLFGKDDDWQSAEVAPEALGQLSYGQRIIVDDEAVFMSRRGANQEDPARREEDRSVDELRHKWLRVLAVDVDGLLRPVGEDVYVRAETIRLVEKPDPKKIALLEHGPQDEESVSGNLEGFEAAWKKAAAKRRRSIDRVKEEYIGQVIDGAEITSGWNWDKYDEGVDVSGNVKQPQKREAFEGVTWQRTLSANYDTGEGNEPVAYMVLEVRKFDEDEPAFMYIRWLIAHPEKGGGGSALMKRAKSLFEECGECAELRVESAYSAVEWYKSQGFKEVDSEQSAVRKGFGYGDTELVYKR